MLLHLFLSFLHHLCSIHLPMVSTFIILKIALANLQHIQGSIRVSLGITNSNEPVITVPKYLPGHPFWNGHGLACASIRPRIEVTEIAVDIETGEIGDTAGR